MDTATGVEAESTLGAKTFLARKYGCEKNNKMSEFYVTFARKAHIFHDICRKIFFRNFGGHMPPTCPRLLRLWILY